MAIATTPSPTRLRYFIGVSLWSGSLALARQPRCEDHDIQPFDAEQLPERGRPWSRGSSANSPATAAASNRPTEPIGGRVGRVLGGGCPGVRPVLFSVPFDCKIKVALDLRSERSPMTRTSLTEAEFDRLSSVLERFGGERSMNLEQLDGFLAALVCGPDNVLPSEYLQEIWGGNVVLEGILAAQPIFEDFLSLLMRHWNTIVDTLRSGDVYLPLLLPDEHGIAHANDWANGFMRGMGLRKADWADLLDDEEHGGWIVPILALAHEHDPDPKMRPYPEPISTEVREKLIVGAAAGVTGIYRYFQAQRLLKEPGSGGNDPCPCGSGKKFKHCCGVTTLH
jgi:uncharacterized protein